LAQDHDFTKGDANSWVDACDPSYKEGPMTAGHTGVGVDCQGFAQKRQALAQDHDFTKGDANSWVDACDPSYKEGEMTAGHSGVGVDCQGFAQKKAHSLAQVKDHDFTKGDANAWVDACDASYKEGAMSGQFGTVGVDC